MTATTVPMSVAWTNAGSPLSANSSMNPTIIAAILVGIGAGIARQLAADGKVPAPGSPPAGHVYLQLCLKILQEKICAKFLQPLLEIFAYPMPDNVKESIFAARFSDLCRDIVSCCCPENKWANIDNGNQRIVICRHLLDQ